MKTFILTIMLFGASLLAQAQQDDRIHILEVTTFKDSIAQAKVQLIDVRTPEEFEAGHIETALNIDFFSEQFNADFEKLEKDKPVYIYCKSGNRSGQAAKKLAEMGFEMIYDLKGDFLNYQ